MMSNHKISISRLASRASPLRSKVQTENANCVKNPIDELLDKGLLRRKCLQMSWRKTLFTTINTIQCVLRTLVNAYNEELDIFRGDLFYDYYEWERGRRLYA
jgi:hypothetical protein